jgi:hypothetical protein
LGRRVTCAVTVSGVLAMFESDYYVVKLMFFCRGGA